MVLVDNNPISFLAQPSNGIPVPSFYDDPEDDALSVRTCVDLVLHDTHIIKTYVRIHVCIYPPTRNP